MQLNSEEKRGLLYVALAVGMFATSPVLVRLAAPVSSFEITFWRMALAAPTVLVLSYIMRQPIHLPRGDMRRFIGYGLVAALHFLLYIASLSFTTIAHSLSIVYTAPIFIAILSSLFLGEHMARRKYLGIGVTIVGVAILAGFEPQLTPRMLFGDVLALGSALCFGLYSVFGRSQRSRYPLLTYAFMVYAVAALWLAPVALVSFQPVYSPVAILSIVLLGVFPLGLGHTLYNAAIRKVHAAYANLIATQEVTGGIILGALILQETPGLTTIVGALVALAGIMVVLLWE
jgi:drug/metabolite transporter (DMT)-like permease